MQHRRVEHLPILNIESPQLSPAQTKESLRCHLNNTFSNWKIRPPQHNDHQEHKDTESLSPRPRQLTDFRGMTLKEYFRATPEHLETEPTASLLKQQDDEQDDLFCGELDNLQIDQTEQDRYNDSRQSAVAVTPNFSNKMPLEAQDSTQIQDKIMSKYCRRQAKLKTEIAYPPKNTSEVHSQSKKKSMFPAIHNTKSRTLKLLENEMIDTRKKRMTSNPQHDKKNMRSTFTYFKDGKISRLGDKQKFQELAVFGELCMVTKGRFYQDKIRYAVKL